VRAFEHEAGGHRWQRVPPGEKRGRVHSSSVTVAVLREATAAEVRLDDRDLDVRTTRSGGPGGQHANKTDSAVIMTHKPTGITVRVETKSQHRNKEIARGILMTRLLAREQSQNASAQNSRRQSQVGSGMRGDKTVTISIPRNSVVHHGTGKRTSYKRYSRGYVEDLW
jgi:peptide chain release factor 1